MCTFSCWHGTDYRSYLGLGIDDLSVRRDLFQWAVEPFFQKEMRGTVNIEQTEEKDSTLQEPQHLS